MKILKAGLMTTIQDLGRFGYQKYGITRSGAMDPFAAKLANLLVGNNMNEAVLEFTLIGPTIKFLHDSLFSIAGGDFCPRLNHRPVPIGAPIIAKEGDILELKNSKTGTRGYIALKGGIDVPSSLGSKSSDLRLKLDGLSGRKLEKGDCIPVPEKRVFPPLRTNWRLSPQIFSYLEQEEIRVTDGLQKNWFQTKSLDAFCNNPYQITSESDRMGMRLDGEKLERKTDEELLTEGVAMGTIQVPPSGKPIVLMADCQTTGGYPKIGQVITADLPILAQKRPGECIYFSFITVDKAHQVMFEQNSLLNEIKSSIQLRIKEMT
ncbi:biotin-dependent carboxyltransferase family protein [Falsibacillus pallidus]|uniref:5-oxoprolinase subunit C family protein n=1 Tax=Falsibacillus pallidus TaxID=493781 RepID=UPI003D96C1A8